MESNFEHENQNNFDRSEPENQEQKGYTVTPEGGYYSRNREDIVQDQPMNANPYSSVDPAFKAGYSGAADRGNTTHASGSFSGTSQNGNFREADWRRYQQFSVPVRQKKKYGAGVVVLSAVLAAVIGLFGGVVALRMFSADSSAPAVVASENSPAGTVNITVDEMSESVVEAVYEKVARSVVGIRTTTSVTSFFGGSSQSTGEGSGVIYSQDGYIITNYHVIESAADSSSSKIEVFLDSSSSESYDAEVVGYNISNDLAVLKINVTGLAPAEIGSSANLKVGQFVVTIGNPGGLEFMKSATYGVISGLDRVVSSDSNVSLIQTDAAINPGNSGGALLNTSGQLIGINSSKIVSEEYEGMGFAIPVDKVVEVCQNIISKENEPTPYVGITVSEKYTADVLSFYGYPTGAVVLSVADSSPAQEAGIRKGDIITEFGGQAITQYQLLNEYLKECSPGDRVEVKIYRSGRYYTTTLTVASNNEQ